MDNNGMISAITSSIQTEANLIALITAQITGSLEFMSTDQLQAICAVLEIDYTQPNTTD